MFKPELLSPAGSLQAMRMAFAYGADAVYAGQPRFSLRVRNNEFDVDTLAIGIAEAHQQGKRFYVVCNIAPHNAKLTGFIDNMRPVVALQPDALIVSDPGIIYLLREHFPELPLHLSVQANTVNWAAVKFWHEIGIQRIILSRELGLDEIAEIRTRVPEMEIEVFVHGALCMAYSGRCLLSGYFNKRDPNQGACTNACRWEYRVSPAYEDPVGQLNPLPFTEAVMLEEPQRPNEYMPMFEDLHGTYIMNSKDLRAVQHVDALAQMGIHSLKIEGRTKSPYYVARTAQVYRQAIDDAMARRPFNQELLSALDGMANRGFTEGFLRRHIPQSELQNYVTSHSFGGQQLVAEATGNTQNIGQKIYVEFTVKNKLSMGDSIEWMHPQGNVRAQCQDLLNQDLAPIQSALGSGYLVWLPCPKELITRSNLNRIMLIKDVDQISDGQKAMTTIAVHEVR